MASLAMAVCLLTAPTGLPFPAFGGSLLEGLAIEPSGLMVITSDEFLMV